MNRAMIFVSPASEWETLMSRRKKTDLRATYITEQVLLGNQQNYLKIISGWFTNKVN